MSSCCTTSGALLAGAGAALATLTKRAGTTTIETLGSENPFCRIGWDTCYGLNAAHHFRDNKDEAFSHGVQLIAKVSTRGYALKSHCMPASHTTGTQSHHRDSVTPLSHTTQSHHRDSVTPLSHTTGTQKGGSICTGCMRYGVRRRQRNGEEEQRGTLSCNMCCSLH